MRYASVSYDYHFWRYQYLDVGGTELSRVINGDIRFYYENNINGAIEDGSQRSFFPTGYPFYVYARTLFDASLNCEEICEEYFSCAFGEEWRQFYDYLEKLGRAFDYSYMTGECGTDSVRTNWYDPSKVESLSRVKEITDEGEALIRSHYNSDYRIRTVSVRLLEYHIEYARLLADALIAKAKGNDDEADELYRKMRIEFGKRECAIERFYDHGLAFRSLNRIFEARKRCDEPVIF